MLIGEILKKYRESCNLSQEKLSELMCDGTIIHCSKSTICRIENGLTEPSFEFILTFMRVIVNLKPNIDISIFSFIPDGFDNVKKLEETNIKELSKAINNLDDTKSNEYVNELFNETFIIGNPIPKYLLSFDETKIFIDNLYNHFQAYKNLCIKKHSIDKIISEHPEQKHDKNKYKQDFEKPISDELAIIKKDVNQFLKNFLDYYCNPLKKPTE